MVEDREDVVEDRRQRLEVGRPWELGRGGRGSRQAGELTGGSR